MMPPHPLAVIPHLMRDPFRKGSTRSAVLDSRIYALSYLEMQKRFWVYILTTHKSGTLYTGVTNDLPRRLLEHTTGTGSRFTRRYSVKRLVWYEEHATAPDAIAREKAIKRWPRTWKIELIEAMNPDWFDLGKTLNM